MTTEFPPFPNGLSFEAKPNGAIPEMRVNTTTSDVSKDAADKEKEAVIDAGLRSLDHCMTTSLK